MPQHGFLIILAFKSIVSAQSEASNLTTDGECERTGHCFPRGRDEKAAQRQSRLALTPVGQVDQRRSRLVGMGDPEMYECVAVRRSTSRRGYTSRRFALLCSQRPILTIMITL